MQKTSKVSARSSSNHWCSDDLQTSGTGEQTDPGSQEGFIEVGGLHRTYLYHVPSSYDSSYPMPLVLGFHGRFGTGRLMETMTHFSDIADQHGFVMAYPDGVGRSWNGGHGVGKAAVENIDDVKFVSSLIDALGRTVNIDHNRVYGVGMSNGGVFAYRLACELGEKIAAVAVVSGSMASSVAANCPSNRRMPIFHIHGTADRIAPWGGAQSLVLSVSEAVDFWVKLNRCWVDGHVTLQKGSVTCVTYCSSCEDDVEVTLCRVEGGGHTWPGGGLDPQGKSLLEPVDIDINASQLIWEFFARHRLPAELRDRHLVRK